MLHTHEVTGSSPVVSTKRISVTVAHRTLTPFAGVRIPHPLPKNTWLHSQLGVFYIVESGIRTHSNATLRGRVAALPPGSAHLTACTASCRRIPHPLPEGQTTFVIRLLFCLSIRRIQTHSNAALRGRGAVLPSRSAHLTVCAANCHRIPHPLLGRFDSYQAG